MKFALVTSLLIAASAVAAPVINTTPILLPYRESALDVNVDGTYDLDFYLGWNPIQGPGVHGLAEDLLVQEMGDTQVFVEQHPDAGETSWVQSFAAGSVIGPTSGSLAYHGYNYYHREIYYHEDGRYWSTKGGHFSKPAIMGFRFQAADGYHWGWAQLSFASGGGDWFPTGRIDSYGYESRPNTPISAGVPEPASLGLLALGALPTRPKTRARLR